MALSRLPIDDALAAHLDGLVRIPPELQGLYQEMADHPRAEMMTHPELGALLEVLVRATGGRAVLEVGTFVGTSAGWMARGLAPGGRIDTLEIDPEYADRAERFLAGAGLAERVSVHRGPALETLAGLSGPYDLCYIDADKAGYGAYLDQAIRLVRPGGLILADNVLAGGRVGLPPERRDESVAALAAYSERAVSDPRLRSVILTVGDGVALSVALG